MKKFTIFGCLKYKAVNTSNESFLKSSDKPLEHKNVCKLFPLLYFGLSSSGKKTQNDVTLRPTRLWDNEDLV